MLKSVTFRSTLAAVACLLSISAYAISDTAKRVDISRGSLTTSLQTLAKQTGTEFIYSSDQLKDIQTQGVHGTYTAEKAVTKLLEGTKLHVTIHETGALLITGTNAVIPAEAGTLTGGKGEESSGERLQLAQANQGATSSIAQVDSASYSPSPDSKKTESSVVTDDFSNATKLQEVMVTATRRIENVEDVPISIAVLTAADIDQRGQFGAEDYLPHGRFPAWL